MKCTPEGKRGRERPRLRWIDKILEDVKVFGLKNWWAMAKDREVWKKIRREAELHDRLWSYW